MSDHSHDDVEGTDMDLEGAFGMTVHGYTQQVACLDIPVELEPISQLQPLSSLLSARLSYIQLRLLTSVKVYLRKMTGRAGSVRPRRKPLLEIAISTTMTFCSILMISVLDEYVLSTYFDVRGLDLLLVTGVYAATTVMLFDQYHSPMAQPRNVIGGFLIGSTLGVCTRFLGEVLHIPTVITASLTVMFTVLLMNWTLSVHPPAAGAALLAVIGDARIKALGWWYIVTSTGTATILLAVAVTTNNLFPDRQYPLYWY